MGSTGGLAVMFPSLKAQLKRIPPTAYITPAPGQRPPLQTGGEIRAGLIIRKTIQTDKATESQIMWNSAPG